MTKHRFQTVRLNAAFFAFILFSGCAHMASNKDTPMTPTHVSGTFSVKMLSQPEGAGGVARVSLDKTYTGALTATGQGEMISHVTATPGSAAYSAIERIEGSLDGKFGSFMIQHRGVMDRASPALEIAIVPDSGTGALTGLTGQMGIRIENGQHFYDLEYMLRP